MDKIRNNQMFLGDRRTIVRRMVKQGIFYKYGYRYFLLFTFTILGLKNQICKKSNRLSVTIQKMYDFIQKKKKGGKGWMDI